MGEVIRFHARASAGSRIKVGAGIPVTLSIRMASPQDTPRFPLRISDRCDFEHPTAFAKATCDPSKSATRLASSGSPSMPLSLPQVNLPRQEKVYCGKIDISHGNGDHPSMPDTEPSNGQTLYIGEWIKYFGLKQKDVAKKAGIGKSYLNLLCTGKRDNPSYNALQAIADALELTIDDLKTRPPISVSVEEIQRMPAGQLARIRARRKAS